MSKKDGEAKPQQPDRVAQLTKAAETLQAVAKPLIGAVTAAVPVVIGAATKAYAFYSVLPKDVISVLVGFIFCFFGGVYPTLFAAIQAAEHGGRKKAVEALKDISQEATIIIEASKKDDEVDADKDGVKDVKELDGKALLMRKAKLVFLKMNPERVDKALGAMYSVWLSVVAALTIQFARTISLALTISDFLNRPVDRYIAPTVNVAIPDEYDKWTPVIMRWITKSIAMAIAWYIQTIISAVSSALSGGLIMSRGLMKICRKKGFNMFGLIPDSDEETVIDEIMSYLLAAAGFYFQFKIGFTVPFPLNLILFPFQFVEYYIRWAITGVTG
jgi:hypothetical protein|uniref:Uncharacterized protein n=1 Tax=Attheya septentrionalis TaxID=420275 RepID=A0A7S2XXB1_9STRA|mmetsp:Transcript_9524/g.17283  ORF Transcript_9524/g.17283 Transcript_9524/m.17283 type:complete len:330 (+) Transcript_9524:155-1144(+)|eukprot:CAMPEP_0198303080 /NCGR_PEP_ID=MMETSP1449-20131203/56702_1 /TAXON_ID=420275 /ORGANISM="Attheya septentrionalis, Strain CCMP2084" /LENGTH=329 /DNA_ID=CAMNT_0044005565 /DNA_START=73 /DNA_END=1062 /DNA_ORIENTATION=+